MTQQTLTRQQAAERLCDCYAVYFDITHSPAEDAPLVAEMAFHAHTSKYVLSKKHVLWEANAYDHALILRVQTLTAAMVEDWFTFLTREAEPELVHPGASCPPEGHMASTLTLILMSLMRQTMALNRVHDRYHALVEAADALGAYFCETTCQVVLPSARKSYLAVGLRLLTRCACEGVAILLVLSAYNTEADTLPTAEKDILSKSSSCRARR